MEGLCLSSGFGASFPFSTLQVAHIWHWFVMIEMRYQLRDADCCLTQLSF
jgi:hypothetical protein